MFAPFIVLVLVLSIVVAAVLSQSGVRKRRQEYLRTLGPSREPLSQAPACPRCRAMMTAGYLLDRTHGGFGMGTWVEGIPQRGWNETVRPKLECSIPVLTYRCTGCGLLESYARPEYGLSPDQGGLGLGTGKPGGYQEL